MTCLKVDDKTTLCFADIYEMHRYGKTYVFEWHSYFGPTELRKSDHEPKERIQSGFWGVVNEFQTMSKEDQEHYRI